MPNVAQVEFFHFRAKTVVRFFDTENLLTAIACESARLSKEDKMCTESYLCASPAGQAMISREAQDIVRAQLALSQRCLALAQEKLRDTIETSRELAIENRDYTFRPAESSERCELCKEISEADSVWVFVFESNDLYSLSSKIVASAM